MKRICPRCLRAFGPDLERCPEDGSALRSGTDPLVGRILGGRYRLIARVGSGGMSSVYLARHAVIDRRMAIKTLRRDLAKDPIQRDRFLREARAVNRINHDNIVEITDFGETEDGLVYLAMEFVDGVSLFKAMADAPFAPIRALHIAEQTARALARAHQMGVVHRDLKPDNVLLTQRDGDDDFVKILDFGIAKIFDAPSLTGSQQIFGTPGYIAPEYIQSTQIDGRADLYSLGVILYEMVTGALPFDYEYPGDLLVKHVTEPPVAPAARLPGIGPGLEAFLLRCLRKDPSERFRDAHHFLAELRRVGEALSDASEAGGGRSHAPRGGGAVSMPTLKLGRFSSVPPARPAMEPPSAANDGAVTPPSALSPAEVSRWRKRVKEATKRLAAVHLASDPDVVRSVQYIERALVDVEEASAACQRHQVRIEVLDEMARDSRGTLGRAMDELGRRHSEAQGELERATLLRDDLRARRDAMVQRARGGDGPAETDGDALLWELASAEETLRHARRRCEDLRSHLEQLEAQLAVDNERVEGERAHWAQVLDREMARLEALADGLESRVVWLERQVARHCGGRLDTPVSG